MDRKIQKRSWKTTMSSLVFTEFSVRQIKSIYLPATYRTEWISFPGGPSMAGSTDGLTRWMLASKKRNMMPALTPY